MPVRDIVELAGQRNDSALHYHFGSRAGLLDVIVEYHNRAIQVRTEALLRAASVDGRADEKLRRLFTVLALPLSEQLQTDEGRDYLRILAELTAKGEPPGYDDSENIGAVAQCLERVAITLVDVGVVGDILIERMQRLTELVVFSVAGRARRIDEHSTVRLDDEQFVSNLIEMAIGACLAPTP
ncbi:hypothetical protein BH10ACT3_BH10ACT3_23620 [soil metagenome]